ncbi:MAG: hypothetical protein OEZ40_07220 [Candidatus Bathyarchaeota archaeon]|nr:hypothetical protein [Candidatus Bathyarchaeota archaeon]
MNLLHENCVVGRLRNIVRGRHRHEAIALNNNQRVSMLDERVFIKNLLHGNCGSVRCLNIDGYMVAAETIAHNNNARVSMLGVSQRVRPRVGKIRAT